MTTSRLSPENITFDTQAEAITMLPMGAVTHGQILKTFEVLRRRISRRLIGQDGFYPGFSAIDFEPVSLFERHGHVVCSAHVTEVKERTHTVAYVALLVQLQEGSRVTVTVLTTGHGRTFAMPGDPL